ncbi:MAG: VWA-like domain-containing protein [Clostridia bacterium]|jgi:predicted metal-dependent peptidase
MSKEADKKIAKARVAMIFDTPFFGYLALNLEPVEDKNMTMKTMATDGKHLFYDHDFIMGLDLENLKAIIAHEVGHVILWHLPRMQGRDLEKWNYAADYADNDLIRRDFRLPPGCLIPDKDMEGKSAEYNYNHIPDKQKNPKGRMDDHSKWGDWGKDPGDGQDSQGQDSMEVDWREKVAQAATAARMKGKLPGHIGELVDGILQPKLTWQALLRDMVTSAAKSDFRLFPPNKKHLYRGFVLPSITGEEIKVGVGIDTSGSISHDELVIFLSEIKGICDQYENHTIFMWAADTEIDGEWEVHEFDELPKDFKGRGGTDFRAVCERADTKEISCLIFFTDLEGTFPDHAPKIPVIWVTVGSCNKAPFGTIIEYPRDKKDR